MPWVRPKYPAVALGDLWSVAGHLVPREGDPHLPQRIVVGQYDHRMGPICLRQPVDSNDHKQQVLDVYWETIY